MPINRVQRLRYSFGKHKSFNNVWYQRGCGDSSTLRLSGGSVNWYVFWENNIATDACVLSCFSCVRLFVTVWTVACQAALFTGFSRQEYWSGLPCPLLGDLPNPAVKPASLMSPVLPGGFFTTSTTWEAHSNRYVYIKT